MTQAPIASFDASPGSPLSQENVTFDASASSDPDGPPADQVRVGPRRRRDVRARYRHDVLDDDPQYATPGVRTVRLRVTDQDGATAVDSLDLTVQNRTPTADVHQAGAGRRGHVRELRRQRRRATLDGSIAKYEWSFDGDDNYEVDAGDHRRDHAHVRRPRGT